MPLSNPSSFALSRLQASFTISINANSFITTQLALSKSFMLLKVQFQPYPLRLRLYPSQNSRTNDFYRNTGTAPNVDSGLIFEGIFSNQLSAIQLNPVAIGHSEQKVYYATINNLSNSNIENLSCDLFYIPLEA
ncbi:hypothetical protein NIES4103_31330 [Nostoc sp. NIES-4103]|nr:hypothetical protein NIES4103_31330 [Nostoc sp. NIES-4103]